MASRMSKQPGHRHSREFLQEVVSAVVPPEDCERYMPFARELYVSFRQQPPTFFIISGHDPQCRTFGSCPSTVASPPRVLDYSRRTKLVVMKHFQRGLSGRLLALIGQSMLARLFPPSGSAAKAC